ncbi:cation:proton antiporter [Nocardia sp. NPDC020380]|uniref:cation:proton antiporter n=1 Tax=Nocardia sp. NPDC020380 TaxID=3364309 RepID=UPI0037B8048A
MVLEGVLPPLLYSSAVSMPAMNFRREFGAISGLSVLLVVGGALLLGVFFMLVIPGLSFAWGVALGAIVSPTDAVATSIIKQTSVSKRVVAMLDGESLLNDATALVLLRTAIVATSATFSFWGTVGTFGYSVAVAVVIGWAAGRFNLVVRRRVTDPTVNTVISFTVPFVASVPAEALGASGLVAAVVAGLVTGIRAPRDLSPLNRLSDSQNWRTIELVLEGAVFLTMGVQIDSIVRNVQRDHGGVGTAVLIAAGALAPRSCR